MQIVAAMAIMPSLALSQTSKVRRLALLAVSDEATTKRLFLDPFLIGMREQGYLLGRDFLLEVRHANGAVTRLPELADELIARKPDLLLGIQNAVHVMAAKTSAIPIVLVASSDPVAAGLVDTLARPGKNVTGMTMLFDALIAKQIELLGEIIPGLSRVAYLGDDSGQSRTRFEGYARSAAKAKHLALIVAAAHEPDGIRRAFAEFEKGRAQAIVAASTAPLLVHRQLIIDECSRRRLPSIFSEIENANSGGLVTYGADTAESYRTDVPLYVDKILKGARPADLPVQQPTRYRLVINARTAKQMGIEIPRSLLLRADRVIE